MRGKAGAEVEFGNKLTLDPLQGLIMDYKLHPENPSDSKLVAPSVKRLIKDQKLPLKRLWSDRAMHSKHNEIILAGLGVQSGLCPRNPIELKARLSDPAYQEGMKRRGGTEARIGIFKNVILSNPLREKSLTAREKSIGWGVLSLNLWVLERMKKAKKAKDQARPQGKPPAAGQRARAA